MITRLSRKNRKSADLNLDSTGGLLGYFDNQLKIAYRINDRELDFIAQRAEDDELTIFTKDVLSFNEKRAVLEILTKYLNLLEIE